jgi:KDO2-lipid IV(A) lauroyltransferase
MPRRSHLKRIRDSLFYLLILVLVRFFNALPRKFAIRLGGFLGSLGYYLFPKDRKTSIENLRLAFGRELSSGRIKKTARQSFANIGKCAVDVFRHRKLRREGIQQLVKIEGLEYFDRAYKQNRGLVAITGHLSNFELMAAFFSQSGYKVSVVGRKIYDERLNRLLVENREIMGMKDIDADASPKGFIKHLREARVIGVLIDQDSRRFRGVFVNFFGRDAYTPVAPFVIAQRTNSPIVPTAIFRNRDYTYTLKVEPAIPFPDTGDREKDIITVVQRCTDFLERMIREHPEQWVWMHRRWRTRPPGETA